MARMEVFDEIRGPHHEGRDLRDVTRAISSACKMPGGVSNMHQIARCSGAYVL